MRSPLLAFQDPRQFRQLHRAPPSPQNPASPAATAGAWAPRQLRPGSPGQDTQNMHSDPGCGSKPMVAFGGFRCTTHFRTYFSGDWSFDPWPPLAHRPDSRLQPFFRGPRKFVAQKLSQAVRASQYHNSSLALSPSPHSSAHLPLAARAKSSHWPPSSAGSDLRRCASAVAEDSVAKPPRGRLALPSPSLAAFRLVPDGSISSKTVWMRQTQGDLTRRKFEGCVLQS